MFLFWITLTYDDILIFLTMSPHDLTLKLFHFWIEHSKTAIIPSRNIRVKRLQLIVCSCLQIKVYTPALWLCDTNNDMSLHKIPLTLAISHFPWMELHSAGFIVSYLTDILNFTSSFFGRAKYLRAAWRSNARWKTNDTNDLWSRTVVNNTWNQIKGKTISRDHTTATTMTQDGSWHFSICQLHCCFNLHVCTYSQVSFLSCFFEYDHHALKGSFSVHTLCWALHLNRQWWIRWRVMVLLYWLCGSGCL